MLKQTAKTKFEEEACITIPYILQILAGGHDVQFTFRPLSQKYIYGCLNAIQWTCTFLRLYRSLNSHHFHIASPATATQRAKATEMPLGLPRWYHPPDEHHKFEGHCTK